MLDAAKKENIKSHTLYEPSDFTTEEYERRNVLAVMVIDGDLSICKFCGRSEGELEEHCSKPRALKEESAIDFSEDDTRA